LINFLRAQKKGGKRMETFAADGGVQPHSQPQSDPGKPTFAGSNIKFFRDKACLPDPISAVRNGLKGQPIVRSMGALRLHPAFNELNLADWLNCRQEMPLRDSCQGNTGEPAHSLKWQTESLIFLVIKHGFHKGVF
jgi:hypothetical protein